MLWNKDLTGASLEIAEALESPLRVSAGPGTGKTFSLMRRVLRLLEQEKIPAERILVSTLTRTSANDLVKNIRENGHEHASEIKAMTLHSFCSAVLSKADVMAVTGRSPRSVAQFEIRFMFEDLLSPTLNGVKKLKDLLKAYESAWARLQTEEPGYAQTEIDEEFQTQFLAWMKFHRSMHVGELVPECLRYLRENPTSQFLTAFDHVLVDEYQDLNRADQEVLDLLSENGKITIIGDEDQSIYSFRYANPEGISKYRERRPETKDASLEVCYRCPTTIVEMANHLISNNKNRTPRTLKPKIENDSGEIHVVQWNSILDEATGVAEFIQSRISRGEVEAGKVIILTQSRDIANMIRSSLHLDHSLSCYNLFSEESLDGNPKKLEQSKAQQAFTLLNLLVDAEDRVALRCWLGFGSASLRSGIYRNLRNHCQNLGDTPKIALEKIQAGELTFRGSIELADRYTLLLRKLEELRDLRGFELYKILFSQDDERLDWLRAAAFDLQSENKDYDASKLREKLSGVIMSPEVPEDSDLVRIMSLHKSKGLTADLVVVAGCIQGIIPRQGIGEAELEEARRLFYVASTRAKKIMVFSSAASIGKSLAHKVGAAFNKSSIGSNVSTIASIFLNELGPAKPRPITGTKFLDFENKRTR